MGSFSESMDILKGQIQEGDIIAAYQGLMEYIAALKSHLRKNYPQYDLSGSIYPGYLDMTYFPIFTEPLKARGLKVALVFVYQTFRFEAWLSAKNKNIQNQTRKLFIDSGWEKHPITASGKGVDSILDAVLVNDPDFSDLESLTKQIEAGTQAFIRDVETFLSQH